MMYESTEYILNRAVENYKLEKQVHSRELLEKDEIIQTLQKRLEKSQRESRDYIEFKRIQEKELRELSSAKQYLRHELSAEQAENERLKGEIARSQQIQAAQEDKIIYLEGEHDKAKQIIKNLLKKLQLPKTSHQSSLRQTTQPQHLRQYLQ